MTQPAISARLIGRERQPLVVVDGFAPDPDALRAAAALGRFTPAGHHYPGLRAPVPPDYVHSVQAVVATVLREVFGHGRRLRVLDVGFAMVTTPPASLSVEQRLPHVDALTPGRIALVHYLSDDSDGTAFFRHRATGFETIDEARGPAYFGRLEAELRAGGPPPPGYLDGDTPLFERTTLIEAKPNRALLYRSALLHSGAIRRDAALSPDPAVGRLTVTAFLAAE